MISPRVHPLRLLLASSLACACVPEEPGGGDEIGGESDASGSEGESGSGSGSESEGIVDMGGGADGDMGTETETDSGGNPKPAEAPDWVVIAVSGHCIPPDCELPDSNYEYLEAQGTAGRFADTLEAWGESVEIWSYADEFYNRDAQSGELLPGEGEPVYYGFLQLHADLERLRDEWVLGFDDPTKILVLAHSHGVVWAHTALLVVDELPVEVMIDLDGKSLGWEAEDILLDFGDDWAAVIADYNQTYGVSWPFDIADAEAGWELPGVGTADVEDVIGDSIAFNLEIQATAALIMPFPDDDPNHRLDGSSDGILLFESQTQDHLDIDSPEGQAINWAIAEFAQLVGP